MYRKILIGGVAAAAIVGAGGTALALSGSDSTTGRPATTVVGTQQALDAHPLLKRERAWLRRVAHGQVVVRGADGFVTHDVIVGKVSAVSPTAITVRAADGVSETFAVTSDTKVRVLGDGTRGLASIDKIATGDRVAVGGTGTSTLTAEHVVKLPAN
jgi:hypothetical protein